MKYRIFSLLLAVCFFMGAALPAMASEVVDTKYNYTPLPGYYWLDVGAVNKQSGAISAGGADFVYTLGSITDTTNTHYKIKLNADTNGQYDYLSFVVFTESDNIEAVSGYLEDGLTSYAAKCEYSVVSGSELSGTVGSYAVTVLVDCSGFSGDVNVEISGHLGKGGNAFFVAVTGYSVSSYSGVLVDYWDDTLELLRQILAELQKGNGLLSDIKTALAGFRSDVNNWLTEIYLAIQLNFTTLFNKLDGVKTSLDGFRSDAIYWFEETFSAIQLGFLNVVNKIDTFWKDTVYWFEETFSAIQLGFLNVLNKIDAWGQTIRDALVGEHYTQDDDFAEDADSVTQENQDIIDQIQGNTPTIPLDDMDPSLILEDNGVDFGVAGNVLTYFIGNGLPAIAITISFTFTLLAYALYGKR